MLRLAAMTCLLISVASYDRQVVKDGGNAQPAKSIVLRDCDDIKNCDADATNFQGRGVNVSTSVIIVYLYDVTGAPVANQTVMAMRDGGAAGRYTAASARTDAAGMAAISVVPGTAYTIQIADIGWAPLTTEAKVAIAGRVRLLHVQLKVPPIS